MSEQHPNAVIERRGTWSDDVNLSEYLIGRQLAQGREASRAIWYQDVELTYAEVADLVARCARVFSDRGVGPGDRVLMIVPDTPTFVSVFLGALYVGAIAIPLSPKQSRDHAVSIARRTRPKLAVVDETFGEKVADLQRAGVATVICGDGVRRAASLERELGAKASDPPEAHREAGATAYCLFSSGTTGVPKGIPHVHSDILECIEAYSLPVLGMSADDRVLAVPKLSFGYGLGGNLLSSLYVGCTAVLFPERSDGASIAAAARRCAPTLFLGQPRVLIELLNDSGADLFGELRLAVSAGEVLNESLYRKWKQRFGVELLDGFGSTEVGHVFITNRAGDVRPGAAGKPVDGFDVVIRDDLGSEVGPNTVGHMWVRGPSLATGYWEDPERTEAHFVDGWLRTGDLGRIDEEGYIYATGRADEMIKAGCGEWVSPIEIESALQADSAVADCAVVGYSDEYGVVRPKAYVVLAEGQRLTPEVEQRLKSVVALQWPELPHKHLGEIEAASALPRGATGKLQRFKLRPMTLTEFSYEC